MEKVGCDEINEGPNIPCEDQPGSQDKEQQTGEGNIPIGRAKNMREVRNTRKESRKRDRFKQLEGKITTGKVKTRLTRTGRGAGLLRSSQVHQEDLQDRTKPMVVVGADVESLYPSLSDIHVADIIKAIMESLKISTIRREYDILL